MKENLFQQQPEGNSWKKSLGDVDPLTLKVFLSFEEAAETQSEWDKFIESIEGEIFLTYDWCRAWWKYYGKSRALRIYIFRADGAIVGILPIFCEKVRLGPVAVRVLKIVGTDFMPITVTIPISNLFLEQVINAFLRLIGNSGKWDILYFGAICGRYNSLDGLVDILRRECASNKRIIVKESEVQTYYTIANSWEEQFQSLPKNSRKNVRKAYRALQQQGKALSCTLVSGLTFPECFDAFVELHQSQWRQKGSAGHFTDWPFSYGFHRDIATTQLQRGHLRFWQFNAGSQCIGYVYGFRFGTAYYLFLDARNKVEKSTGIDFGRLTFCEYVKAAVEEGVKIIDSMRGRYEHKILLGGKLLPINNIYVCTTTFPGKLIVFLFRLLAWALNVGYLKLWRRRIALWLRLKPKPFWEIWIRSHMFTY